MQETHQFVYLFPSNSLNAFCHTIRIEHPDTSSVANSADGGTKALLPCSLLLPQLSYKSAGDEVLPLGMCITEALPSPFLKQSQRWHSPLSLWTRQAIFFSFQSYINTNKNSPSPRPSIQRAEAELAATPNPLPWRGAAGQLPHPPCCEATPCLGPYS